MVAPQTVSRRKELEDIEKDNEYEEYLARSVSLERLRNSYTGSPSRNNFGSSSSHNNYGHTSPSRYQTPSKQLLSQTSTGFKYNSTSSLSAAKVKSPMRGNEEEHLVRALK